MQRALVPPAVSSTARPARAASRGGDGLFSPAARLMRSVPFRGKAWLISAAFCVPLLLLVASFWTTKQALIDSTRMEVQGVDYAKAVLAVTRSARLLRVAALADIGKPEGRTAKARAELTEAVARLDTHQAAWGASPHAAKALATARRLTAEAPASYDNLFKAFTGTSQVVAAWHDVLDATVEGSGLALDPEPESYYALQVGLVNIPKMYESLGRTINLSAASSATGQGAALAAIEVSRADAIAEEQLLEMADAARKLVEIRPELQARFEPQPVMAEVNRLRELATDNVGGGGEAQSRAILERAGEVRKTVATYQDQAIAMLEQTLLDRVQSLRRSLAVSLGVTALGLALAAYLFVGFSRSMKGALREVTEHVCRVAEGDLRHAVRVTGRDELADILQHATGMRDSLVATIGQVSDSAGQVASVSEQLHQGTQDLAHRTEHTASQLQQTASSMEEMQATVANTASATQAAADLAARNASLADEGGRSIAEVVRTMDSIRASALTIQDIVSLIDAIAFQTNILALNAAVEAARAGQEGRGFAVVAGEVRTLAQRSAAAAKDIRHLIGQSVEQAQAGAQVVDRAGQTMTRIVSAAGRMQELLSDIARATAEQASGITLVNGAVAHLDQMTQQNAALVEQTQAAARAMNEVAATMVAEARRFQLPAT